MEVSNEIQPITKQDLNNAKYWIKNFGGGLKQFAQDIGKPYSTVRAVLSGQMNNGYVIEQAVKKAIEVGGPISSRFQALKSIQKF